MNLYILRTILKFDQEMDIYYKTGWTIMAGRWVSDTSADPNVTWRSQRHLPYNVIQTANYAQFYGLIPLQGRAVIILSGMEYGSKDVDCHVNRSIYLQSNCHL